MDIRTVRALIPFAVVADLGVMVKVFGNYADTTLTVLAVGGYAVVAVAAVVYYYRTR